MSNRWGFIVLWSNGDRFYYGHQTGADCIQPRLSPDGVDRMCPAWRRRIEKAKEFSERHRAACDLSQRAAGLTEEQVREALEVVQQWEH